MLHAACFGRCTWCLFCYINRANQLTNWDKTERLPEPGALRDVSGACNYWSMPLQEDSEKKDSLYTLRDVSRKQLLRPPFFGLNAAFNAAGPRRMISAFAARPPFVPLHERRRRRSRSWHSWRPVMVGSVTDVRTPTPTRARLVFEPGWKGPPSVSRRQG